MVQKRTVTRSQEYSESIINTVREPLIALDQDLRVVSASRSFYEFFEVNPKETIGQLIYDLGNKQWNIPKLRELLETILPQKATFDNYEVEHDFTTIGRRIMLLNARQIQRVLGKERIILLAIEDITERKRAEEALRESHERYSQLANSITDVFFAFDKDLKYTYWNAASEKLTKISAKEAIGKSLYDLFPDTPQTKIADERYREVLKTGLSQTFVNEYKIGGKDYYFEISAYPSRDGISVISKDITERKRAEEELQKSLQQTKKVLEEVVLTLSSIVEKRDPYTAGHQRRVADLACSIAGELNLPEVQIEGIRVAGIIHDIGKINVPAEILSKTGRLSEAEFNIIKTHAQVGKEILEPIDFPWPVAQIVHQHHERLNGTGYPQGLSDGKIILEAKIMAVADVVEAMASHRPYRPALGIEKALEEISNQSGILYAPQVASACRELFDKKGYKLAQESAS